MRDHIKNMIPLKNTIMDTLKNNFQGWRHHDSPNKIKEEKDSLETPMKNLYCFIATLERDIKELRELCDTVEIQESRRRKIYSLLYVKMPECIECIKSATAHIEHLLSIDHNTTLKERHVRENN
ncbi:MAG: hypothetical protein ACMUJM_18430 [bacterium]